MDNIRKSLIVVTVLTFFYGLYYWGIPALINIEKRMPVIEEKIHQQTGYKISVKDPYIKMGHTPAIWFMAENAALLNDDGSKAVNLEHSAIKIHLLPLLTGKIHIGNFSSDKIDINLTYTQNSKLQLGQYPLENLSDPKLTLTKAYFRIGNYKVNLNDLKQNKKILLDGSYLTIDEFKNNKRIKLSTFAKLMVGKKASEIMADVDVKLPINKITEDQFKVNGRITNLNLADFSEYAKALPDSKIKSLSGIVNMVADTSVKENKHKNIFSNLTIDNLGIMQQKEARSIYCKNKINIKMDVDTIKNGINIRNMKILSKGINITINGKATKLDAKTPYIDLKTAIDKSRTESFIPLLPGAENLLEEVNFYALKNNFFYGDINGNINIKGRADTPDVTGKILVSNGYLNNPLPNNTPKASIKLAFNGQKMLMDVKVPASHKETVLVNGDVELYGNKNADLYIKSTPEINLKIAQTILNPLHEILKFDLGPVPIMDLRGIGNIDLHVTGNRKNPHAWGEFNFKNTTASFLDIHNMVLKNGAGKLIFNDENTYFHTTSAALNGRPVSVDGECTLKGVLDFNVTSKQQDLGDLIKIIKTSPMLADLQKLIKPVSSAKGLSDFTVSLTGNITDVNDVVFNKNIFAKGSIVLFSNSLTAQGITLNNLSGRINFENLDSNLNLKSNLGNSIVTIKGQINDKTADIKIFSDKFVLKDGLNLLKLKLPMQDNIGRIHSSFTANYKGSVNNINPAGIDLQGKIYAAKGQSFSVNNASFSIKNSNFKTSVISGFFKGSPYSVHINASNILTDKQSVNGNFQIKNFNLSNLNEFNKHFKSELNNISNFNGTVNLNCYIKNNGVYTDTALNNISFVYNPLKIKIRILSGQLQLRKNILSINKLNSLAGEMPVFIDGKVYNIDSKPVLGLYINAKPSQEFVDQIFNNKAVYPIKLKGDINCSSTISGPLNAIRNKTLLKLAEGASIYYMGATLGGSPNIENQASNAVNITIDNTIYPNGILINNLNYDKLVQSQNNKLYTKRQLNASGSIGFLADNDIKFNNFKVKTLQPTDAKIFNIIFRKPLMKQGIFTSDITINGKASAPVIFGKLNITSIDMPLFDATIKDIALDFKRDKIYLNSKGVVLTNNLNISAIMKNNPHPPLIFEEIKVNLEDLDLNKIAATFRDYEADSSRNPATLSNNASMPDISQIIIRKADIIADKIKIKNLTASDFSSRITLDSKKILEVPDFKFSMANGEVKGNINYNFNDNIVKLAMDIKNANAQIIAETLFDLKGQIFGSLTGNINLSCKGQSHDACMSTLNGNGSFNVEDGRMPKLGSLEYLLKAGNLVKGGITGLSINGIIDLITPYKTGDFDSISGNIHIVNGIADNIQIYSAGQDLNMFMRGSYNFTNLIADMQIFGALTKNFSTLFGKIGNASLNTLFNTIPGINVSEAPSVITEDIKKIPNVEHNASRMFTVDIYGDINGDNYVRSFRWIK